MTRRTGHLDRLWVEQSMFLSSNGIIHQGSLCFISGNLKFLQHIYIYMHIFWDIILRWLCLKIGCPKCSWFVSVYHHFPLLDRHVLWALSRYTPQWTPQNGLAFICYIVNISIYLMVDIPHTYICIGRIFSPFLNSFYICEWVCSNNSMYILQPNGPNTNDHFGSRPPYCRSPEK